MQFELVAISLLDQGAKYSIWLYESGGISLKSNPITCILSKEMFVIILNIMSSFASLQEASGPHRSI